MDLQLSGKRALVTGSSSGIGEAIAKSLAAEGVAVVVHGRREAEAKRVAAEIAAAGGKAVVAIGDLSSDAGADAVAKVVNDAMGGVDILVNNAGAFPLYAVARSPPRPTGSTVYNQNVGSMVRLITRLVPGMKQRGWGRVISLASVVATMPFPGGPAYAATKSANANLAVSLAKELAGTGITSNAVSPGMIVTPGVEEMLKEMAPQFGLPSDDLPALEAVRLEEHGAQPQRARTSGRHRGRGHIPGQPAGRLHQRREPPRGWRNRADGQLKWLGECGRRCPVLGWSSPARNLHSRVLPGRYPTMSVGPPRFASRLPLYRRRRSAELAAKTSAGRPCGSNNSRCWRHSRGRLSRACP